MDVVLPHGDRRRLPGAAPGPRPRPVGTARQRARTGGQQGGARTVEAVLPQRHHRLAEILDRRCAPSLVRSQKTVACWSVISPTTELVHRTDVHGPLVERRLRGRERSVQVRRGTHARESRVAPDRDDPSTAAGSSCCQVDRPLIDERAAAQRRWPCRTLTARRGDSGHVSTSARLLRHRGRRRRPRWPADIRDGSSPDQSSVAIGRCPRVRELPRARCVVVSHCSP